MAARRKRAGGLSFLKKANSAPELLIPFGLQWCREKPFRGPQRPWSLSLRTIPCSLLFSSPGKRLKPTQSPPLSAESKDPLDCQQPRGHAQWGLWAWPPIVRGKSPFPETSSVPLHVSLRLLTWSRSRHQVKGAGRPHGSAPLGGPFQSQISLGERGSLVLSQGPCWSQGKMSATPTCVLSCR